MQGGARYLFMAGGDGYIRTTDANRNIHLQTGGANTRMTIRGDNGNVGIGTLNPLYKLDVIGDIRTKGRFLGGTLEIDQPAQADDPIFVVRNSAGQIVFAVYESGVRMYVDDLSKQTRGGFAVGDRKSVV